MEGSNYIIFLIITQETSYICNVEGTNSMFQEIHMSHRVTVMWLERGHCSTPLWRVLVFGNPWRRWAECRTLIASCLDSSADQKVGCPGSVAIHYIYIWLIFLCRLLYSSFGNMNPYSSISSVARNLFWNSNVAWAYYLMDSSLGHQQSFWPLRKHQMRMSFQSSVLWYALIVWWMYWVCWAEAVMLGALKEAHFM